jgi:quercetin dioxygenase-like cupin family protein
MPDSPNEHRPHAQTLAAPYLEFDIARELDQLHREAAWKSGQNAKTLVKYDDLRIVLTALKAQSRIPDHSTEGRICIQTISGHIQVRALGRTFDLRTGTLLALDKGVVHSVEGVADSAFLLTLAWPGRTERQGS